MNALVNYIKGQGIYTFSYGKRENVYYGTLLVQTLFVNPMLKNAQELQVQLLNLGKKSRTHITRN